MNKVKKLKGMLESQGIIVAPGVYDCVGAKLVEQTGFQAVYMGGNGSVASRLGKPDIGLASMNQMAEWASAIDSCVQLPLICDFDNGYGDLNNVRYSVQAFEKAGVAAIHLEDQVFPKKCGAMKGVAVIPTHAAAEKIKLAVKTREEMLIIARSDCLSVEYNLNEMINRLLAFSDAGADILYPESVRNIRDLETIVKELNKPVMFDILECIEIDDLPSIKQLEDIGVKIAVNALSMMWLNCMCMKNFLKDFKENGDVKPYAGKMMNIHTYEELLGIKEANDIRKLID